MDAQITQKIIETFKISEIAEYQYSAITSIIEKRDVFISQPTGSGKSLVYQALPLAHNYVYNTTTSTIIVVQPIIALMRDQLAALTTMGIPCIRLRHEHGKAFIV